MASMGLPGFSGFVAEMMILIGAWHAFPLLATCVGLGILIGVIYIWRAMQKAFFAGDGLQPIHHVAGDHGTDEPLPPITFPERLGAIILIAASITIGLYPQMLLKIITPALNSPLFQGLQQGVWK